MMKRKLFFGVGIAAFILASCGGAEGGEESTNSDSTVTVEEEVMVMSYSVDTAETIINWYNTLSGEKDHEGTVKASGGYFAIENDVVREGSLTIDMMTIVESQGAKLQGHLTTPDFFDVGNFATAEFTFDRHEEGIIYGTVNVIGMELAVEAVTSVDGNVLNVSDFIIDLSQLPFFLAEVAEKPAEEQHDANVGITATIVGAE